MLIACKDLFPIFLELITYENRQDVSYMSTIN